MREDFRRDGYVVLRGVVPEPLLVAADAEIDALLEQEPPPEGTVGQHFYWRSPTELPAAAATLAALLPRAEQLAAPLENLFDQVQVALNVPPYDHVPGLPHVDGHRPEHERPDSFTLLAGVYLGDESTPGRGNLWVWPGSHETHAQLFRRRGTSALLPVSGHAGLLEPPVAYGKKHPVTARRGDVLLAHFLLGHNTGGNLSATTRRILYFRLAVAGHRERSLATLTDPWLEFS